jgi:hypothetical protein
MRPNIQKINVAIEPLRQEIINHKVYAEIKDLEDLKIFMNFHIYAVWDFMSLLKSLQNNLTCTSVPWFPVGDAKTRHLINEIVVGEESDVDREGITKSHFELYLEAMNQCGANVQEMDLFISSMQKSIDFKMAYQKAKTPKSAQNFVNFTFDCIHSNKSHVQAAVFTFGREDLIPAMFHSIVSDMHEKFPDSLAIFKYYLERHIEVDGDHHSNLALEMTSNLCGTNEVFWQEAEQASILSLKQRIALWDGIYEAILLRKNSKNLEDALV